jgi:hypothetical protein
LASRLRHDAYYDDYNSEEQYERPSNKRRKHAADGRTSKRHEERQRGRRTVDISKPFKCRHCKAFIGLPFTGGKQRNHCPGCLHSLHVDGKTPGDRASDCGSLMAPAGSFFRPNGEQVLLHRCLGCGFERHNRVAADDNPLLLMRLALIEPRLGSQHDEDEAIATA